MYPNQRIGAPFGDVFFANTPALDKLSDRLYQEDRQRKIQQDRDAKMLDDEFARNMSGIRDADIPDLTKAYGDWKIANQQLIKNKGATPEQQLEVLRKKAQMYDVINKSKAQKEQEKAYGSNILKSPNQYIRDAHGGLVGIMKTPVSKLGDNDPFEGLRYKGNATNFTPLLQKAAGKVINMEDEVVDNPKSFQKDVTKVKRLNNANEYFDAVRSGIVGSQGADDFVRTFGNISPEAYDLTEQQYNQMMTDPVMAKRFGNPAPLPPTENLTDTEKIAKYMAMQHALVNHPITEVGKSIPDWVAREDYKFDKNKALKLLLQDRSFANQRDLLNVREKYKKTSEEEKIKDVDGFIDDEINEAKANPLKVPDFVPTIGGMEGYKLKASPIVLQAFAQKDESTGKTYTPDAILYDKAHDNFLLLRAGKDGGNVLITRPEYRAALVNHVFNTKVKLGQINTDKEVESKKKSTETKSSSTTIKRKDPLGLF